MGQPGTQISAVSVIALLLAALGGMTAGAMSGDPQGLPCGIAFLGLLLPFVIRASLEELQEAWRVADEAGRRAQAVTLSWPLWGPLVALATVRVGGPWAGGAVVVGTLLAAAILYELVAGPRARQAARARARPAPTGAASSFASTFLPGVGDGRVSRGDGLERVHGRRGGREVTLLCGADGRVAIHAPADEVLARTDVTRASAGAPGATPLERAFAGLLERHGLVRARTRGRVLDVTTGEVIRPGPAPRLAAQRDRVLALLDEVVKLAGRPPTEVGVVLSPALTTGSTCPYCRDALSEAATAACARCGTAHHAECLDEAGGCTVFGCGGGREAAGARVHGA